MNSEGHIPYQQSIHPSIETFFDRFDEKGLSGEYVTALQKHLDVLDREPDNPAALLEIAYACNQGGDHHEALAWFNRALFYDPYNAEVWYSKGLTLQKTGSREEGLACIRKGLYLKMGVSDP